MHCALALHFDLGSISTVCFCLQKVTTFAFAVPYRSCHTKFLQGQLTLIWESEASKTNYPRLWYKGQAWLCLQSHTRPSLQGQPDSYVGDPSEESRIVNLLWLSTWFCRDFVCVPVLLLAEYSMLLHGKYAVDLECLWIAHVYLQEHCSELLPMTILYGLVWVFVQGRQTYHTKTDLKIFAVAGVTFKKWSQSVTYLSQVYWCISQCEKYNNPHLD